MMQCVLGRCLHTHRFAYPLPPFRPPSPNYRHTKKHTTKQLSEFAGAGGNRLSQRYVEMVPPLEELVVELKLDPEVT